MRLLNVHRKDARNVGDMKSSPQQYFQLEAEQDTVDVLAVKDAVKWSEYDAVIIGGGGLLEDVWFMPSLTHISQNFRGKIIIWGVGFNNHFSTKTIHFSPSWRELIRLYRNWLQHGRDFRVHVPPEKRWDSAGRDAWLRTGDLVGIRDYGRGWDWVPCVSCMDKRLDEFRQVAPTRPLVIVDHPDACKIQLPGVPRISNLSSDFEGILAHIASGETVLASSYHAAYWGLLLGRRVVVVPWSEKFYGFKHRVPICMRKRELADALKRSQAYPEALEECRAQNLEFVSKVAGLLSLNWSRL